MTLDSPPNTRCQRPSEITATVTPPAESSRSSSGVRRRPSEALTPSASKKFPEPYRPREGCSEPASAARITGDDTAATWLKVLFWSRTRSYRGYEKLPGPLDVSL